LQHCPWTRIPTRFERDVAACETGDTWPFLPECNVKLSNKSQYACLALIKLSREYEGESLSTISEIAESQDIPKKYLEQILLTLKRGGYVTSYKGASGGYKCRKDPSEISVAEIIRLFDGPLAPVESVSEHFFEHTPLEKSENLLDVFREIREYAARKLENTHFSDLI